MRNLKKVLSLVLAVAMMVSICMVGAGAVDYDSFTDKNQITKTQAVETLVSLDVIKGYNDGATFNPTGNVTRAEMATMICRVLAGGDNMIPDATKPVPTFNDVPNTHWAVTYIEYCNSLGIVSGKTPTSFDPDANVTAAEAAKMVMTALGYNADIEGFKGNGWDINSMAKASTLKLLTNLTEISASVPLTREQVAQFLYNALSAPIVQNYNGTVANTWISSGATAYQETLLETKFHAEKLTGVIIANEYADLYGDTGIRKGTTQLALMDNGGDLTGQKQTVEVSTELLDIGQSVIVYWNKDTKRVLYGDTQDTGTNVVREFKTGGKFIGGDGLDRSSVKDAEYFVNYNDAYDTDYYSDWRIEYNITLNLTEYEAKELLYTNGAATLHVNVENGDEISTPTKAEWENNTFDDDIKIWYVYEKAIRVGDEITDVDMSYIKEIFTAADKENTTIYIGEVYVGTKSTEDVSDELSYREFYNKYIGTKDRTQAAFESNENGNYVRAVDFNNDGDFDYIMKIKFEMHEVDNVDKDGDVRFSGAIDGLYDRDNNALDTVEAADLVASDELVKADIVLTTYIDGKVYVDQAPTFEGEVDSYNMRRNVLTVEGTEYEESEILEYTGYQNRIADAEKKTKYIYYQDHFGYIRVYAYPPEAEGNYVLLTDGWFREKIDENEYAVKAFVDGEIKTYFTTGRTSREFIDDSAANTQNNSWRNLIAFNKYETDVRTGYTSMKYPTAALDTPNTNSRPHDPKQAVTNIARYGVDDDDVMTLNDVKTYAYDKQHKETNIKVDYVDLLGNASVSKGQTAFQGYYIMDKTDVDSGWYTADPRLVDHSIQDSITPTDWSEVTVQATRETVFYYVTREGDSWQTVKSVKTVTGYRNTLAVAEDDILAMYAVATNTGKDKNDKNYWVADVIVIETKGLAAEAKDVFFNVYASEKNNKDIATSDAILETGKTDSLLVKTPGDFDNYNNPGQRLAMDFYTKSEPDGDGVVTVDTLKAGEYAKYGIYAAQVDRVNGLLTYLTVDGGTRKTLEYNSDDVIVYALDSTKNDKYNDPIADAIIRQNGTKIDVKPGDRVIAFCDRNDVVYIISIGESNAKIQPTLVTLYNKIKADYISGGTTSNSQKIANAWALTDGKTCDDYLVNGVYDASALTDALAEMTALLTAYNTPSNNIQLTATEVTRLNAMVKSDHTGTLDLLEAEVRAHEALEDAAAEIMELMPATVARAAGAGKAMTAALTAQHAAICAAASTSITAIEGVVEFVPATVAPGPVVAAHYEGSALVPLANAQVRDLLSAFAGDKADYAATQIAAVADKADDTKTGDNNATTGYKTMLDRTLYLTTVAGKDQLVTTGALSTEMGALEDKLEEADVYSVTTGTLIGATVVNKADKIQLPASTANALTQSSDTLVLTVTNSGGAEATIVVTATQGGKTVSQDIKLAASASGDVTLKLTAPGTWTLTTAVLAAAAEVNFELNGTTVKLSSGSTVTSDSTKISMVYNDTVTFTVTLPEGYAWAAGEKVSATNGSVVAETQENTFTYTKDNSGTDGTITINAEMSPATAQENAVTAVETAGTAAVNAVPAAAQSAVQTVVDTQKGVIEALDPEAQTVAQINTAKTNAIKAIDDAVITEIVKAVTGDGATLTKTLDFTGTAVGSVTADQVKGQLDTLLTGYGLTVSTGGSGNLTAPSDVGGSTYQCTLTVAFGTGTSKTITITVTGD